MYKRVLVPLDGSELAEQVLVYAKEFSGRLDSHILLLHVCGKEQYEMLPMHRAYVDGVADRLRVQSDEVRARIGQRGVGLPQLTGKVVVGYPAEEILGYADEEKADIILMATHGRSGITRWVLGSVADKVLRASPIPVLLVRTGTSDDLVYDKWPKRVLLVPLDGSKLAESVLPHVETLAGLRGPEITEVVLLRVNEPPAVTADYPAAEMPLSWEEHVEQETARQKQEGERYLAEIQKGLENAGIKARSEVLVGRTADAIIDYSNQNRFSMILMATHGRSGLSRWAYGSVAEKVLIGGSSPLLLVRPH